MLKIIWDKLTDILGDKMVLILLGILIAGYGIYHINQYVMTKPGFAQEKDKIEDKIESVDEKSSERDRLIEYKILDMEQDSVEQQQWALEDRIEEQGDAMTISQQGRMEEMDKRKEEIRRRKIEIQKELLK